MKLRLLVCLLVVLMVGVVVPVLGQETTPNPDAVLTPTPVPPVEDRLVTIDIYSLWQSYTWVVLVVGVVVLALVVLLRPIILHLARQVSPEVFDVAIAGIGKALKELQKKAGQTTSPVDNVVLGEVLSQLQSLEKSIRELQGRPDSPLVIPGPNDSNPPENP